MYIHVCTCAKTLEQTNQKKKYWGFLFCFVNHYYPINRPRFPPDFCICGRKEPGSDHLQLFWKKRWTCSHPARERKGWNGIFFYHKLNRVMRFSVIIFSILCLAHLQGQRLVCAYTKTEKRKGNFRTRSQS